MIKSKIFPLFFLIFFTTTSFYSQKKEDPISLIKNKNSHTTIDLLAIQKENKLGKHSLITIVNDPVYHKKKTFKAIDAVILINKYINKNKIDIKKTKIIFECIDGYKPEMPLELFLNAQPFIAFEDTNAPKGLLWEPINKNGNKMNAAPFYMIYPTISTKDTNYKWPYNLIKIHFENLNEKDEKKFPATNKKAEIGYQLYKKNCISCHAINGVGGEMGPELNNPKNITEYWVEKQLVNFIVNPAAFRNKVKMPTLGLTPAQAQDIVNYLKYEATISKTQK